MLGKLLKYEIPAVGRRLVPLYIALAASSVLLGIALRTVKDREGLFIGLSAFVYVGITVAIFVMSVLMVIMRYNKSLLGNEAYFNQVLPVTVNAHIANKTISALLWTVLSVLVSLLSALLVGIFGAGIGEFLKFEWFETIAEIWQSAGWQLVLVVIESILMVCLSVVKSILAIYAAITIAHQAKKHQALLGIGAYIVLLIFESLVANIFIPLYERIPDTMFGGNGFAQYQLMLSILLIALLVLGAVYFFICKFLMEKHLNLD